MNNGVLWAPALYSRLVSRFVRAYRVVERPSKGRSKVQSETNLHCAWFMQMSETGHGGLIN